MGYIYENMREERLQDWSGRSVHVRSPLLIFAVNHSSVADGGDTVHRSRVNLRYDVVAVLLRKRAVKD